MSDKTDRAVALREMIHAGITEVDEKGWWRISVNGLVEDLRTIVDELDVMGRTDDVGVNVHPLEGGGLWEVLLYDVLVVDRPHALPDEIVHITAG